MTRFFPFDLKNDPGERQDLYARRPDIVRQLLQQLADWERSVDPDAKAFK